MIQKMKTAQSTEERNKFLDRNITTRQLIFIILVFSMSHSLISPPIALLMGLIVAQFINGHLFFTLIKKQYTFYFR